MNKVSRWWNKDKIHQQELEDKINNIASRFEATNKHNEELQQELDIKAAELEQAAIELAEFKEKEKEYEDRQNSTEPWVEIKGERIDPVRGISLELDWNQAFIEYLKENGITGTDEDHIIQKWLSLLYGDLIEKFEERVVDNRDHYKRNEFE